MKSLKVVMLVGLAAVGLAGCGECQHVDDNKDHLCDKCGVRISDCKDEQPQDHFCDYCGTKMSDCKDDNHDHNCDICGKQLSEHVDSDHSGECDICGTPMEVHHKDENGDGYCDVCGIEIKVESFVYDDTLAQRTYVVGEAFNGAGVTVTAVTTDEKEISIPVSFKLPDMTTPGSGKVVEVSFVINGVEEKRTFNIDILYWGAESIALLDYYTLVGHYGGVYLPYISGLEAVEDEVEGEFYLSKENATVEDLKLYGNLMKNIEDVVGADGDTYTFKQLEDIEGLAELYGFERCYAFYCIPFYVDEDGYSYRDYTIDEYFVVGLTEGGELKVCIRDVFALLDGYMGGSENLNDWYDVELIREKGLTPDFFYAAAADLPGYYCSSLAAPHFVFPSFEGEKGIIGLTSVKTLYPFDEALDDYLIIEEIELIGGSESEFDDFVADLLAAGYVATPNTEKGFTDYVFEDTYVGEIKYRVFDFDPQYVEHNYAPGAVEEFGVNEGYYFYLYYTSPFEFGTRYVNEFSEELDNITGSLIDEEQVVVYEYFGEYSETGDMYDGFFGSVASDGVSAPTIEEAMALLESNLDATYFLEDSGTNVDSYGDAFTYKIFNNGQYAIEIDVYNELISGLRVFEFYVFEGEETMDTLALKVAVAVSEGELPTIQSGNHYRQFNLDAGESAAKTYEQLLGEYTEALGDMFEFGAITEESGIYTVVGEEANFGFILTIELSDVNGSWVARFTLSDKPFVGGIKAATGAVIAEIKANYELDLKANHYRAGLYIVTIKGSESATQDQYDTICVAAANKAIENALPYGYTVVQLPTWDDINKCYVALALSKDGQVSYTIFADAVLDDESNPDSSTISTLVEIYIQNSTWKGTTAYDALIELGRKVEQNLGVDAGFNAYTDGSYDTEVFIFVTGAPIPGSTDDVKNVVIPVVIEDLLPGGAIAEGKLYSTQSGWYVMYFQSANGAVTYELYFKFALDSETTVGYYGYVVAYPTAKGTLSDLALNYYSNMYSVTQGAVGCAYDEVNNVYSILGLGYTNVPDAAIDTAVSQLQQIAEACAPYAYGMEQAGGPYDAGDGWTAIVYTDFSGMFTYTFMYKVTSTGEGMNSIEVVLQVYETPAE